MPTALDTPSDAQDLMNGVSREQLDRTAKAFASLPRKLQTEVVLKGAPESRKEAMELVRQYDLTPKEKRTLFTVLDIPDNQHTVDKYQHVLGATPKKVSTDVSLFGVASASQQVSTLLAQLHALTDHGWNFTALGNVPGSAPHREHGGPVKAGQGYVVGERRPEYFVPKVDGTVLPKVPDMPSFDNEDWGGHVGSGEPIVVQVVLERKVLAEATFDVARDRLARS